MKLNVLVTGADGQLGQAIKQIATAYPYHFFFKNKKLDITDDTAIRAFCTNHSIHIIINAAAYTAVDLAEVNTETAYKTNVLGVKNLALIAKEFNIKLIHLSSDYVFDGLSNRAYQELDLCHPINVYGQTKYQGECRLQEINPRNSMIVRASTLFSAFGHNFVKTITQKCREHQDMRIVVDQIVSPSYAPDLAQFLLNSLDSLSTQKTELYHYALNGQTSFFEIAQMIAQYTQYQGQLTPIRSLDYPSLAKRPPNSTLDNSKIKKHFSYSIDTWQNRLQYCLKNDF